MEFKYFKVVAWAGLYAVGSAVAADFKWSNVSMGGGGFVSAIIPSAVDENLFYARTDVGGAYRWDESAGQWVSMMDWVDVSERGLLGIEALAVDPQTSGKVYMVAGTTYWNNGRTAFLRSENKGETWETLYTWDSTAAKGTAVQSFKAHGNGMGRGNGEALAIDPNDSKNMFYGSKNKGLFKSTNNGNSWTHVDAFTTAAGSDTTWNGSGFSFVTYAPGSSTVMYAGFLREGTTANSTFENVFKSINGGASWSALPISDALRKTSGGSIVRLMPQRIAVSSDGAYLYITFSDGAGPHTMTWDEGWGMIYDGFGRGAVLKYDVANNTWTDISPEDYLDYGNAAGSTYDKVNVAGLVGCSGTTCDANYPYAAPYGGISINPNNSKEIVITTEGYSGGQYWKVGTAWKDQWGTQIFYSTDGGKTWIQSFRYESGTPSFEHMDENGIGWMLNSSIHWAGSVAIDPFNSKRVWVSSGNGIYRTDDVTAYTVPSGTNTITGGRLDPWTVVNSQVWKVASHGIEETVPEEVISIPGGPLVSVIADYDGFRHDDIREFPASRHTASIRGESVGLGSTRSIAYAYKKGTLVKLTDAQSVTISKNKVTFIPVQISADSGSTWTVVTDNTTFSAYNKGSVAISADGEVVLWTPATKDGTAGDYAPFRNQYTNWSTTPVSGADGAYIMGDPENANVFYGYKASAGTFIASADKGLTFTEVSTPGASDFKKFRMIPGRTGDIWLPIAKTDDQGAITGKLLHSTDGGKNFTTIAGVDYCEAVGFGKAATTGGYPAIYIYGKVGSAVGVFQSDDQGASWTRINDNAHEYGGLANGEFVMGDMNTYGVVYMSTAGRGIAARVPSTWNMYSSTSESTTSALPTYIDGTSMVELSRGVLQLNVSASEPLQVAVYGMDGRILYNRSFSSSVQLPLSDLLPNQGMQILQVRSHSKMLLTRTIGRIR